MKVAHWSFYIIPIGQTIKGNGLSWGEWSNTPWYTDQQVLVSLHIDYRTSQAYNHVSSNPWDKVISTRYPVTNVHDGIKGETPLVAMLVLLHASHLQLLAIVTQ